MVLQEKNLGIRDRISEYAVHWISMAWYKSDKRLTMASKISVGGEQLASQNSADVLRNANILVHR